MAAMFKIFRGNYHGGSFNGVQRRQVMLRAKEIFKEIEDYLLTLTEDAKLKKEIKHMCTQLTALLQGFDVGFSILRLIHGTVTQSDYDRLERVIKAVDKIWTELGLSKTPKYHASMHHAMPQSKWFGGYGCMLEDIVEKSHQDGDKFNRRVVTLRSMELRA